MILLTDSHEGEHILASHHLSVDFWMEYSKQLDREEIDKVYFLGNWRKRQP